MSDVKKPWLLQDHTVYALNEHGVNRFSFSVQGGFDDHDERTSDGELERVAQVAAAAPELLEALEKLLEAQDSCVALTPRLIGECRAIIAKARGEAQ